MRPAIGCGDDEAMRYLGCSANMWMQLKARRIVVPIVRGWYSYEDLDAAMLAMRLERDRKNETNIIHVHETEEGPDGVREKGNRPRHRKTEELLRLNP